MTPTPHLRPTSPHPRRRTSLARRTKWQVRKAIKLPAWFMALSLWKKALVIAAPIILVVLVIPLLTYLYFSKDIADIDHLMNRNNTGVVVYAKDSKTVIYSTGRAEHHDLVPLTSISKEMQQAVVASEDKDFYNHGGFSVGSTLRAVYSFFITGGKTFGGSTLTQQLAKITLLSSNRSFLRTYQAFSVSVAIENKYSKDQILDMYLNSVYFGESAFGIQDAAKYYFGTTPDKLDLAQSAMLVGLLPAPNLYSPISGDPSLAQKRQATVLDLMVQQHKITDEQRKAALAEQLTYQPAQSQINQSNAPHFAQMVLDQLYQQYGQETVERSGYQVTTTLDPNIQSILQANIANHMGYIQANGGTNAGAVAIDPTNGEVRGLVGSADWNNAQWGKVNMATTARQPGSSFKTIYYSQALADGVITPATILHDVPTDFGGGYSPQDADRKYRGDVTVRTAINESLNIPSVEVMQKLGIKSAVEAANRMGLDTISSDKDYGLSLALGVAEVPLIKMTNAYAALANSGQQYPTTIIKQINDKYGSKVFTAKETSKQVQTPQGSFLISNILSDNKARAPIFGSSLTVPGRTAAVKTGTTDDSRDAWTIGYTPQLAIGVWVGNNNNDIMLNGGSGMAGPIWIKSMQQSLQGSPNVSFSEPSDIVKRAVCYGNGGLAATSGSNTYDEYFLTTALPTNTCNAATPAPQQDQTQQDQNNSDTQKKTDQSTGTVNGDNTGPGTQTQQCPTGSAGTYPNCTQQQCPTGYTGTYPNCTPPQTTTQQCPTGSTGTPPNCTKSTTSP